MAVRAATGLDTEDRSTTKRFRRVGAVAGSIALSLSFAAHHEVRAQASSLVCDAPTNEMEPGQYRYQRFTDDERCEGRITVGVSSEQSPPIVRSATYGTIAYDKNTHDTLYAAVSPTVSALRDRVTLRGRSVDTASTYRLEAFLTPGEVFSWSLELIRDIGPDADEMAFLARLDDGSGKAGAPIVPVRVETSPFAWSKESDDDQTDEAISLVFTADGSYVATVVDYCSGQREIVEEAVALTPYDPLSVSLAGRGCREGRVDLHVTDGDGRTDRYSYELIR